MNDAPFRDLFVEQLRGSRGVIEWRHPEDPPEVTPVYGVCWLGDARGTWYVCWTPLMNIDGLGGCSWTRALGDITPLGPSAKAIVAYVRDHFAEGGQA